MFRVGKGEVLGEWAGGFSAHQAPLDTGLGFRMASGWSGRGLFSPPDTPTYSSYGLRWFKVWGGSVLRLGTGTLKP